MFESHLKPPVSFPTLTGSIITFNSQYAGLPLKSHKIALTATQSGSGTPSPQNIRNINGASELNISATGKNFLRNTYAGGTPYGLSITTNADGSMTINGTPSSDFNGQIIGYFTLPAGTYIYTDAKPENSKCYTYLLIEGSATWYTDGMSFTVDGNTRTRIILFFISGNYYDITLYPMIRPSSITDSTFEPFGTYNTITIGSTVYGGEYDAKSGVLTKNFPDTLTTFNDLTWNYNSSYGRFESSDLISVIKKPTTNTEVLSGLLCECYHPSVARASDALPHSISVNTSGWVYVYDADFTDRTTWLNVMGVYKFLYPLATPTTIQLPPCPIDTLEGQNNIWADTGDTTLQYAKFG